MNSCEEAFGDWGFGQWQQGCLVERGRGALRVGVELAHRLDLVAEELDAHRAVCLRRINVENAPPPGELARHLDDVHCGVADAGEMAEEFLYVDLLATAQNSRKIEIIARRKQPHRCRLDGRDDDRGISTGHFPENGCTLLLHVRMRREIFKGQHIVSGKPEHPFGSNCASELAGCADGELQRVGCLVVGDD